MTKRCPIPPEIVAKRWKPRTCLGCGKSVPMYATQYRCAPCQHAVVTANRKTSASRIKSFAVQQVATAIRNGTLTPQPCELCSGTPVHAHHDDYSKPLEVRWLCVPHHIWHHRENGPGFIPQSNATGAAIEQQLRDKGEIQ